MKISSVLLLQLMLLFLAACHKPNQTNTTLASSITADTSGWTVSSAAGREILTLSSSVPWKVDASSLPGWASVAPDHAAAGTTKVEISYVANTSGGQRMAVLNFLPSDNSNAQTLKIQLTQLGGLSSIVTDRQNFREDSTGQQDSLAINANCDWTISNLPGWITSRESLSGKAGKAKIHLFAAGNMSAAPRTYDATITSSDQSVSVTLHFFQSAYYQVISFNPAIAAPGDIVTLQGNFGTNPSVSVGGAPVGNVTVVDAHTLSFTVPGNANTGKITVQFGGVSISSVNDLVISTSRLTQISTTGLPAGFYCNNGISFVYNGKFYWGLGSDNQSSPNYLNSFVIFDPGTSSWSQGPTIPSGMSTRVYASCLVLNNKVYMGMGTHGNHSDWWCYDPSAAAGSDWKALTPYYRYGFGGQAFVLNNQAYSGEPYFDGLLDQLDPAGNANTGSWSTAVSSMPQLIYSSTFVINGNAYIVGGQNKTPDSVASTFLINPSLAPAVQQKADVPVKSRNAPAFSLNGKGYLVANNTIYEYDPVADKWTDTKTPMPYIGGVYNAAAINGVAYVFAGDGTVYAFK